jgi:hypothetical protein
VPLAQVLRHETWDGQANVGSTELQLEPRR